MRQASKQFSNEQRGAVTQAVIAAEGKTSAEIVPVVATSSGRYDRPEDIVGLWLSMIGMIVAWWTLPHTSTESGSWGGLPEWARLVIVVASAVVGFVIGAVLASHVGWLRLLFTPKRQMHAEVAARARAVFFDSRVHHTTGNTGLLIYVSLYERLAAILADQSIVEKLGQDVLDDLCATLTGKLRDLHPADAIAQTIVLTGERLAPVLPRAKDDVNELSDALITLDR
jgi:putative membrane protein